MFDRLQFLNQPVYSLTPAARMQITLLTLNELPFVQAELQASHMGRVREDVATADTTYPVTGGMLITDFDFHLAVVDAILPDDYQRRTVICIDTEVETVRHAMFYESGLIPDNKDNDHDSN